MSTEALGNGAVVRRRPVRMMRTGRKAGSAWYLVTCLFVSAIMVAVATPEDRLFLAPVMAVVNLAALYVVVLWRRDGRLPLFDVGTLWMASTLVYATFPFLGFMAMHGQWSLTCDSRLPQYDFDAPELATFGWRYVVYIAAFVAVYLPLRGKHIRSGGHVSTSSQLVPALVIVLAFQYAFQWAMYFLYGLNLNVSYIEANANPQVVVMPYFLQQIAFIVLASILVTKLALLIVLMQRWPSRGWRLFTLGWIAFEVISVVVKMGSRSGAVHLLLAFGALYHQFVRPLKPRTAAIAGVVLLAGFLVQGVVRANMIRGYTSVEDLKPSSVLTKSNEFQALFSTAYDIYKRKQMGTLPPVPWQVYFIDLYLEIPSQLLPFEKVDPSEWYLDVMGARGTGLGFMFGVMSQAVLGLDWIELVIRGVALGLAFALFHRWFVRRAFQFWPTLLYMFVGIWTYYTFRATSFWFVHYVVYQYIPVLMITKMIEIALRRVGRRRAAS